MDPNTQKGCMIGCLSSIGIFLGICLAIAGLFAFSIRGCTQMAAQAGDAAGNAGEVQLQPQEDKPFKKVWLSGKGGAKAAHVL